VAAVVNELLNDGMDSSETARADRKEPGPLPKVDVSSASRSSGAIKRISIGPLLSFKLSSFSDSCALSMIDSTVILFSVLVCRRLRPPFGGGMLVTASSAATEGEMASGECRSLRRRAE
jgi:hypothetical protein